MLVYFGALGFVLFSSRVIIYFRALRLHVLFFGSVWNPYYGALDMHVRNIIYLYEYMGRCGT